MKRVFIAQPIEGKTDVEILTARAAAAQASQDHLGEEIEILNTFWVFNTMQPLLLLGQAISSLAQADLAYFCEGWQDSKECVIEHTCATEYGVNVLEA